MINDFFRIDEPYNMTHIIWAICIIKEIRAGESQNSGGNLELDLDSISTELRMDSFNGLTFQLEIYTDNVLIQNVVCCNVCSIFRLT